MTLNQPIRLLRRVWSDPNALARELYAMATVKEAAVIPPPPTEPAPGSPPAAVGSRPGRPPTPVDPGARASRGRPGPPGPAPERAARLAAAYASHQQTVRDLVPPAPPIRSLIDRPAPATRPGPWPTGVGTDPSPGSPPRAPGSFQHQASPAPPSAPSGGTPGPRAAFAKLGPDAARETLSPSPAREAIREPIAASPAAVPTGPRAFVFDGGPPDQVRRAAASAPVATPGLAAAPTRTREPLALDGKFTHIPKRGSGAGGGLMGKVTSGTGESWKVRIYPDGPDQEDSAEDVDVTCKGVKATEKAPTDQWITGILKIDGDPDKYYYQPAVWLA